MPLPLPPPADRAEVVRRLTGSRAPLLLSTGLRSPLAIQRERADHPAPEPVALPGPASGAWHDGGPPFAAPGPAAPPWHDGGLPPAAPLPALLGVQALRGPVSSNPQAAPAALAPMPLPPLARAPEPPTVVAQRSDGLGYSLPTTVASDPGFAAQAAADSRVVQRSPAGQAAEAAAPDTAQPALHHDGGGAGPATSDKEVDELAGRLYDRIRSRLRSELLIGRERAGQITDLR